MDEAKGVYTGYVYVADPNGAGLQFKFQRVAGSWDLSLIHIFKQMMKQVKIKLPLRALTLASGLLLTVSSLTTGFFDKYGNHMSVSDIHQGDVVDIGYGVAKKNDLTGSVTAIKPDEKNRCV